jgi:hypothetical protein
MSKSKNQNSQHFYMISKKLYKKNNKVIENVTTQANNNKLTIKGIINGKRINKTKKINSKNSRKLFPNLIY